MEAYIEDINNNSINNSNNKNNTAQLSKKDESMKLLSGANENSDFVDMYGIKAVDQDLRLINKTISYSNKNSFERSESFNKVNIFTNTN